MLSVASTSFAQDKLSPSADYEDKDASVHITRLSENRKLATVGDTLYMLNAKNNIIWKWTTDGLSFTDIPIIDSQGIIYAIAQDLTWVALDSKTGEKLWQGTANGSASYSQIKLYKEDMYLVVVDMTGYRIKVPYDANIKDQLTLAKGNSIFWATEIPAGAKIQIRKGNVYAVFKQKGKTIFQRIKIPNHFDKPIGKVDARADYN